MSDLERSGAQPDGEGVHSGYEWYLWAFLAGVPLTILVLLAWAVLLQ